MAEAFNITLPNPCFADWNKMRPNEPGAYCLKCSFQVIDFTKMTDEEVIQSLTSAPGKICGRFRGEQIGRPLSRLAPSKPGRTWKALLAGIAVLGGMKDIDASNFSCLSTQPNMQFDTASWKIPDTIARVQNVQQADTAKMVEIRGRVFGRFHKGAYSGQHHQTSSKTLEGVKITTSDSLDSTKTDKHGYFKMRVRSNQKLTVQFDPGNYPYGSRYVRLANFLAQKRPLKVVLEHHTYWMGCPKF